MSNAFDQFDTAEGAFDQFDAPAPSGGGPQSSRRYVTRAEQNVRREKARRAAPAMFPELAEPTPGLDPMEAQNRGNSDAGAALLNLGADSTVNLPANVAGFLGKVAGQVGRNFDPSIDPAQWRQSMTPYHVGTQRGDEVLAEGMAPATQAWQQNVTPFLNRHPLLGAAAETAGTLAEGVGTFLGARGAMNAVEGAGARATSAQLTHKPYTRAPVADVAKRYTVVPEDAQHSAGMPTTGDMTGSTRAKLGVQVTDSEIPVQNVRIATQRATQDLPGQLLDPNGRVDKGLLRGQLDAETVPYQQVAQLPPPQANTLAQRVHQAWLERGGSLKGDAVAESRLMPLMDPAAPPLPTDELLRRWREVNGYASDLRKASGEGSAAAQIKGADLRAISDAILNEIDDRAAAFGSPELVQQLKTARVNMARLHALDDATDSVGWVDPAKLAAMAERHEPLTGGLAEVAADAAAAPRSLRPMSRAIDSQGNQLDRFGREPASWLRNVVGHLGGNLLARRGVESLNRELRAGSGLLRQAAPEPPVPLLYPANAGPQPLPPPEGVNRSYPILDLPPAGEGAPLRFADELLGQTRLDSSGGIPQGAGSVDWQNPFGPGEAFPILPAEGRLAGPPGLTDMATGANEPGLPISAVLGGDVVSRRAKNLGAPVSSNADFASQLGPVGARLDEALAERSGMPDRPRGVTGPRSAQLSDPRLPQGLQLMDDTPPMTPQFGPGDEFPPPPSVADLIGNQMYRGVPEGMDPNAVNDRGFTTWSNQRPVAEQYGPIIGETTFDPGTNVHLGTLEDARQLLGLPPEATAQDIAEAAMRRFSGANRTASYDLPPELNGTPREFIRFGQ